MDLLLEQITEDDLKKYTKELYNYAITILTKIDRPPRLVFKKDRENAEDMLGKTGYYEPDEETIALFVTDRHPKDVLRSFAHELVHHEQNCRGDTENLDMSKTAHDPAYASHDEGLREMEREAFERGNMLFRDWCDMKKLERRKSKEPIMAENIKKANKQVISNKNDEIAAEENYPYPELFQEKERLMKDRMNAHEDLVYQELMKRFINK